MFVISQRTTLFPLVMKDQAMNFTRTIISTNKFEKKKKYYHSCNIFLKVSTNSLKDHFFTLSVNQTIDIKKF